MQANTLLATRYSTVPIKSRFAEAVIRSGTKNLNYAAETLRVGEEWHVETLQSSCRSSRSRLQ